VRFDATTGTVHAMVDLAAPPARVFAAMTEPDELALWWNVEDTGRALVWQQDLRPDGAWRVHVTATRQQALHLDDLEGEYLVVEPPWRLAYNRRAASDDFRQTTVAFELTEIAGDGVAGTRLAVTHAGFAGRADAGASLATGWTRALTWLGIHVAGRRP
jgi:uncharacterized protein YndB with AHSA1/START domain